MTVTREALLTNYRSINQSVIANLGSLIVGVDYAYRPYNTSTGAGLIGQYSPIAGVTAGWPSLAGTELADTATAIVEVINGIVRFYQDTAAPPTIAQGTQYQDYPNRITHNNATTVWTGYSFTPALNVAVAIGDYVFLSDGTNTLSARVLGFEYILGAPKILILDHDLPTALRGVGVYFNVTVGQVTNITVPAASLTLTPTTVSVASSLTAATTRTGSAYPVISATIDGAVLGNVYTTYRGQRTTGATTVDVVRTISTPSELSLYFVGYDHPESGLGFAVYRALSPTVDDITPVPVKFVAPAFNTLAAFNNTKVVIAGRDDYSAIGLLSTDSAICSSYSALVTARASNSLYSELFIGRELVTTQLTASATADINNSQTPGQVRTFVVSVGTPFATAVPGDIIRHYTSPTVYNSYVIASVISPQTATVTVPVPGGPFVAQSIEVWHNLTIAEQVTEFGLAAQAYANRYVSVVFTGGAEWNGELVSPMFVAAACAGLRGYTVPQQSLKTVALEEGWELPNSETIYVGVQSLLASYGVFVMGQEEADAVVRYPNTTDQSAYEKSREGVVACQIAAARYFYASVEPLVGLSLINGDTTASMIASLTNAGATLVRASLPTLGSVITAYKVLQPYVDGLDDNKLIAPVEMTLPAFLDSITLDITVEVA
jgi:hypothetical protein